VLARALITLIALEVTPENARRDLDEPDEPGPARATTG
jgi:hypothetical protein